MTLWARSREKLEWGWGKVLNQYNQPGRDKVRVQVLYGQNRVVVLDSQNHEIEFQENPPVEESELEDLFYRFRQGEYRDRLEAETELRLRLERILAAFQYPSTPEGKEKYLAHHQSHSGSEETETIDFEELVENRREKLSTFIRSSLRAGGTALALETLMARGREEVKEIVVRSLVDYPSPEAEKVLLGLLDTPRPGLFQAITENLITWNHLERAAFPLFAIGQTSSYPSSIRERAQRLFSRIQRGAGYQKLIRVASGGVEKRSFWKEFTLSPLLLFSYLLTFSEREQQALLDSLSSRAPHLKETLQEMWRQTWNTYISEKPKSPQRRSLRDFALSRLISLWVLAGWEGEKEQISHLLQNFTFHDIRRIFPQLPFAIRRECVEKLVNSLYLQSIRLGLYALGMEDPGELTCHVEKLEELAFFSSSEIQSRAQTLLSIAEGEMTEKWRDNWEGTPFRKAAVETLAQPVARDFLSSYLLPRPIREDLLSHWLEKGELKPCLNLLDDQLELCHRFEERLEYYHFLTNLNEGFLPRLLKERSNSLRARLFGELCSRFDSHLSSHEPHLQREKELGQFLAVSSKEVAQLLGEEHFFSLESEKFQAILLEKGSQILSSSHFERLLLGLWREKLSTRLLYLFREGVLKNHPPHQFQWDQLFESSLFPELIREVAWELFRQREREENWEEELSTYRREIEKEINESLQPLLERNRDKSQGLDYLQAAYKKIHQIIRHATAAKSPSPLGEKEKEEEKSRGDWEELRELNSQIFQTARVSGRKKEALRKIISHLPEERFEELHQVGYKEVFEEFHPMVLHFLWQEWWKRGEAQQRGEIFLDKILPFCRENETYWPWCLSFLGQRLRDFPSLCSLWRDDLPSYAPDLFTRLHQILYESHQRLKNLERERGEAKREIKAALAREMAPILQNMENWISQYEEFRHRLSQIGLEKVETDLGQIRNDLEAERHKSLPEGPAPGYRLRAYGLSHGEEIIVPALFEALNKEEKKREEGPEKPKSR